MKEEVPCQQRKVLCHLAYDLMSAANRCSVRTHTYQVSHPLEYIVSDIRTAQQLTPVPYSCDTVTGTVG